MAQHSKVSTHKIQAAVLRRPGGPLSIESLDLDGPRDDEILVRMVASGICHTDLSMCDSWEEDDQPLVLGHEGAGVVEQIGKSVKGFEIGDHVVLSYESCGCCRRCREEYPAQCERFYEANFGFRRLDGSNALKRSGVQGHFFGQSSFATHTLATQRNAVKVPKELPLEVLAPLGCGIQTGAGTVMNSLKIPARASIAVFGTGAVGLAAVMAARLIGCHPIIGVDVNPMRLHVASELGATHTIDNRHEDVFSCLIAISRKGIDYVLETTGDQRLCQCAIDVLTHNGTAAYITGMSAPRSMPGGRKALSIIQGDAVPQRFIPKLIAWHQSGLFPFDRLLKFYEFSQINLAIADARNGTTIKPVLRIGWP